MREIEFRGKSVEHNIWVYGYYIKAIGSLIVEKRSSISTMEYVVDEDSVGQFTGLRDKNGIKIYEGDIVEFENKYTHKKGIAKIEFACLKWKYNGGYYDQNIAVWLDLCDTSTIFEVIGNIYDNPELLEDK